MWFWTNNVTVGSLLIPPYKNYEWEIKMSKTTNISFLFGVVFVLTGCFLPWKQEGDFISMWTYGIQVFPFFKDNGGLLIAILASLVFILKFRAPDIFKKPYYWRVALCSILLFVSSIHAIPLLLNSMLEDGIIGSPTIQFGLILVLIGSILMFTSTLFHRVGSRLIPPQHG